MANKLPPTVRAYMPGSNISKRYIRVDELAEAYKIETSDAEQIAIAAGALYRLTRITLIHR
jgi:hypothetical protein